MLEQVFEVALALQQPDPRKMLGEMDRDTFMYWVAFLNRKKREHTKSDYQQALQTKVVSEMFSKSNRPLTKYLIEFKTEEERLEEQMEQNLKFFDALPIFGDTVVEDIPPEGSSS